MKASRTKWVHGPGGLNCPCCVRGPKRRAQKGANRALRRAARLALKAEAAE